MISCVYCSFDDDFNSRGADIEAQDEDSYTPLLTAVAYGQKAAMETLLRNKSAVDVVDRNGKSVVFIAAEENQSELLKVRILVCMTITFILFYVRPIIITEHAEWLSS